MLEYHTTVLGLELLGAGKIDYLIDEWDEIAATVAANNLDMTRCVINEIAEGTDVYIGFANTPLPQVLFDIYNDRIPVLERGKAASDLGPVDTN